MTDGTPWVGGCFAAGEFTAVQESVALVLRVLLAAVGVFLGWLLAAPAARVLYRVALRRPIPPRVLTASRMVTAIVCGVLVFLLFPLGYGGGGGGRGGGKGPGDGPGTLSGRDKGGKDVKRIEIKPGELGETVRVEMIPSIQYKKDSYRYYLIEGKPPPVTLAEVGAYLKQHKARVKRLDILLSGDSPEPGNPAVKALKKLAQEEYRLPVYEAEPADSKKSD
jgi:hypothetical protein